MSRYLRHIIPAVFLFFGSTGGRFLSAQPVEPAERDSTGQDSARVYHAPDVLIEARSILPRVSRGVRPTSVMTAREIEGVNAVDASDVVGFAPGTFVRQYGGLGGLRTVSLRGTSAQQMVVLVDGMPYRTSADGAVDLSNIPARSIERVEVVRGGDAVFYGANALGGVINLITGGNDAAPFRLEARSTIGSFDEHRFGLNALGGTERHRWEFGVNTLNADGDYPYTFSEYGREGTFARSNADFSNIFAQGSWRYRDEGGGRLAVSGQGFSSDRGVPGPVLQGHHEQPHARLQEREVFSTAQLSLNRSEWQAVFSAAGRLNRLNYRDPDVRVSGPEGVNNHYERSELTGRLRLRRLIAASGMVEFAGEVGYSRLLGDNLDPAVGSDVRRLEGSGAVRSNWHIADGFFGRELDLEGGARLDFFSDIETAFSPSIGVIWRPAPPPLRIRAHIAANFRVPSFVEQYYLNYGNTDLRPERSISADLGATWEIGSIGVLEGGGFLIDTRDRIVAVPKSPVSWSAVNVGRVVSRGIELAGQGSFLDGLLDLRASYTLMRAENRSGGRTDGRLLPYAPQELFNGLVRMNLTEYSVGALWQYVSHRHTLPMNEPETALPRYLLLGANVSARRQFDRFNVRLLLEGSNLLDGEYEVIAGYPMPGRSFRLTAEVGFEMQE